MKQQQSTLTIKFRGTEAEILEKMVESGLFTTKAEVVRSALVKYAMDVGFFSRKELWQTIDSTKRRKVTPEKLEKDLKRL